MIDIEGNKSHIENLFRYVLHRPNPRKEEVDYWANKLNESNDPIKLLDDFVRHGPHKHLIDEESNGRSPWNSGHFYSPLVNRKDVANDIEKLLSDNKKINSLEMNIDSQLSLLRGLSTYFSRFPFPDEKTDGFRYYCNIHSYSFSDALIYWSVINHLKPKRIIEIGSGSSSCVVLDAIDLLDLDTQCTFIDPYPQVARKMLGTIKPTHNILEQRAQDVDLTLFNQLNEGDVLFIDSTHVLKTGSDVHWELTQIIPNLKKGVWVHFHDMFYNFEYQRNWINQNFSWNELYAVQLFLMYNNTFSIQLFPHHLAKAFRKDTEKIFEGLSARFHLNPGGSLWIKKET